MNRLIAILSPLALVLTFTVLHAQSPDTVQLRQGPRWIGVTTGPASDALRAQLRLPKNHGIIVRNVAPDGPAAKSGLRKNDLLLTVDNRALTKPRDLSRIISQTSHPNLSIEYLRAGQKQRVFIQPLARREAAKPTMRNTARGNRPILQALIGQVSPATNASEVEKAGTTDRNAGAAEGLLSNLPNNFQITLRRDSGGSPRFVVEREGQRWEMDGSNLNRWGQALLPLAEGLLGGDSPAPKAPQVDFGDADVTIPSTEIPLPAIELPSELKPLEDDPDNSQQSTN